MVYNMKDKLSSTYVRYNYFDFLLHIPKLISTDMFPMTEKVIQSDVCALDIIPLWDPIPLVSSLAFLVPSSKSIVKFKR